MNNKSQEFSFGTMGEVIENIRTFVTPIDDYTYTFAMSFDYDTWNRIKSMRYPDGELVEYVYNSGGKLKNVNSVYAGNQYSYIDEIQYNRFEQKSYLKYGNGAETTYQYDLLNRLSTLTSISNNGTMQNINYTYDLVNNIDSVSNTAMPLNNGLGAQYFQKHNYDNLYRLTGSNGNWHVGNGFNGSYNLSLTYTDDGKISTKTQYAEQLFTNTLGALSYDYAYNYSQNQIHTLQTVEDLNSSTIFNFQYDANGNLIYQTNPDYSERYLCWDEENRLMAVSDKQYSSYYMYDNGGERTYKLTGMNETMNINGNWFNIARLREETLYSSAYLVATHQGYTKHYYAGSERIASCIGQGGLSIIDQPLTLVSNENWIIKKNILNHQMGNVFGDCLNKMFDEKENGLYNLYGLTEAHTAIMEQYFYHPDHLGSTSWITDGSGNAIQYMHYLPYGEEWIDQQSTSWNAPYTFTGKIKDAETGYNYFGARYYDSKLSVWLSVDPLSDKYPSLSPYTYCANNPIMMVDPDGKQLFLFGALAKVALTQIQNYCPNIKLNRDNNGQISYTGNARTKIEKKLVDIITDPVIEVNIFTGTSKKIPKELPSGGSDVANSGAFLGNDVCVENGKVESVSTYQYVLPNILANDDKKVGDVITGGFMIHEIFESYFGGKIAQEQGVSSKPAIGEIPNNHYTTAHNMASDYVGGTIYTDTKTHRPFGPTPFNWPTEFPSYDVNTYTRTR